MTLEQRVANLEKAVAILAKPGPAHYDVELIASNDHIELENMIKQWLKKTKPKRIIEIRFVADGAEFSYCVMFLYEPRTRPLP